LGLPLAEGRFRLHAASGETSTGTTSLVLRNPARVIAASWRLRRGTQLYDAHFENVDVLLTPVIAHPAPKIGEHAPDQPFDQLFAKLVDYVAFTPLNNIGGGPAIALPHKLMADRLPGSIQLSAPRGGERTLLELAYELEATSPFPQITTATSQPAAIPSGSHDPPPRHQPTEPSTQARSAMR
jgi:amidase